MGALNIMGTSSTNYSFFKEVKSNFKNIVIVKLSRQSNNIVNSSLMNIFSMKMDKHFVNLKEDLIKINMTVFLL